MPANIRFTTTNFTIRKAIQNDNLKSLTSPIRFSLVHAHIVKKIVNVAPDAVTIKNNFLSVLAASGFNEFNFKL